MSPASAPRFTLWLGWTCFFACLALALLVLTLRAQQAQLRLRLDLAENEARLLRAELHAAQNQLEAERLLAAAQNRLWHSTVSGDSPPAPDAAPAPGLPSAAP